MSESSDDHHNDHMEPLPLASIGELAVLLRVMKAWVAFRKSHDLKDMRVACCEKTVELFNALEALERDILRGQ